MSHQQEHFSEQTEGQQVHTSMASYIVYHIKIEICIYLMFLLLYTVRKSTRSLNDGSCRRLTVSFSAQCNKKCVDVIVNDISGNSKPTHLCLSDLRAVSRRGRLQRTGTLQKKVKTL